MMPPQAKSKFVTIITRTLKPGKTYDDYRRAWYHAHGFGFPTTMYTVINSFNPREIISIAIGGSIELEHNLSLILSIDVKERLSSPLDDIVESTITRKFGLVAAIDDFSKSGELQYVEAQVDGVPTDYDQLTHVFAMINQEIERASKERDRLKQSREQ